MHYLPIARSRLPHQIDLSRQIPRALKWKAARLIGRRWCRVYELHWLPSVPRLLAPRGPHCKSSKSLEGCATPLSIPYHVLAQTEHHFPVHKFAFPRVSLVFGCSVIAVLLVSLILPPLRFDSSRTTPFPLALAHRPSRSPGHR